MVALQSQQQYMVAIMSYAVSQDDKGYFKALGARIAQRRQELGLTQVQVAAALGIAQQRYASYEVGTRRIQVSMLPALARVLAIETDVLLGVAVKSSKPGPAPKFQRYIEQISQLPRNQQSLVLKMLEAALPLQSR